MSGLDETKDNIKKKLQLMDYPTDVPQNTNTPKPQEVKTPIHQDVIESKPQKFRQTVYMNEKQWDMFNELCLQQMRLTGKPEKSEIVCEAIERLYRDKTGQ